MPVVNYNAHSENSKRTRTIEPNDQKLSLISVPIVFASTFITFVVIFVTFVVVIVVGFYVFALSIRLLFLRLKSVKNCGLDTNPYSQLSVYVYTV